MADKISKAAFSLDGYSFWKWLIGNGKTIKEIAKVGIPAAIAWVATNDPTYTVLVTTFGKWLLDMLEYYVKERKE